MLPPLPQNDWREQERRGCVGGTPKRTEVFRIQAEHFGSVTSSPWGPTKDLWSAQPVNLWSAGQNMDVSKLLEGKQGLGEGGNYLLKHWQCVPPFPNFYRPTSIIKFCLFLILSVDHHLSTCFPVFRLPTVGIQLITKWFSVGFI